MRQLYILMFLLLAASTAFGHATVAVHRPLAEKAWDKMGFTPDISSSSTAKTKLIDGAEDEDNYAWMLGTDGLLHEVTRSSLHGYNPLTGTSGDVFDHIWNHVGDYEYPSIWPPEVPHRTAKQRAMDLWQDGVRDEGAYSNMQTAFQSNDLYSDDGAGGYHYLGRVSHMLQDMTSAPHILWQNVWASHVNYENFWADQWQDWWTDFGSSETGVALRPTDNLPSRATLWQDLYTVERLTNRWNQVKVNTVNGFMDTMAWITYFRTSIWGEIVDNETEATPATTTPTSGVGAKSNTLRTMFGADYISFTTVGLGGYHYWTIDDQFGYNHYFDAEVLTDDWWPAEGDFPDGHYEAGDKDRYTGRFYFSRPGPVATGLGASSGTWPRYYPDSTEMTDSLAYYYGDCLFPLTIQYNAGLIGLAHPSVTVQASPSDKSLAVYVDSTTYTNSHTFRWPIKSQHAIEAPASQTGSDGKVYTFQYWSDGGARVHNINPTSDIIITAVYTTSEVVTLPASADTYVAEYYPDTNYGTILDSIGVSGLAGYRIRSYVKFSLSIIPSGSTIDSATLRLYSRRCYTGNESQISVSLKSVGGSWTETGLTWNNQPGLSTTLNVVQNFTTTGWHEWNSASFSAIKTLVQRWFAGTETNNGFRLQLNDENYYPGDVSWWSKEYSDSSLRPQLVVSYTPPPPDLSPPTPNLMTWSTEPYETSTSSISMTATTATDDRSPPVYYEFDFVDSPTGGSGGDDRSWSTDRTYTDSGLQANHQYGYQVRARDSAPAQNTTSYSSVSYDYTDIETPSGVIFGEITSTSIQVKSSNTPSGLNRGSSGLYIDSSYGTNSGWKQNNDDYWTCSGLTPNYDTGFRIKARNGDGDETGYCTTIYKYTLANQPGVSSFSNITTNSIQANWTSNGNYYYTDYFCENIITGQNSGWINNTYGWNNTGLTSTTNYSFRVKARNSEGVETEWTDLGSEITHHEPEVVTMMPESGPMGTVMTIGGQYFYDSGNVIFNGGASAEILDWNDTVIHCRVPEGASTGNVVVQTPASSNSKYFTVTNPDVIYVEPNYTPYVENGTETYPFSKIQWGIDAATTSDTVIVHPGRYYESIDFCGKNIALTSTDPNNYNVVSSTIIDGSQSGSTVVSFISGESNSCQLSGFTITGGSSYGGGGVFCYFSSPMIKNCLITDNRGICYYSNYYGYGGGIYIEEGDPIIDKCYIIGNFSGGGGGIACASGNPIIRNSIIACNVAGFSQTPGAGIFWASPGGSIENCTIVDNILYNYPYGAGVGIWGGYLKITNSIIWNNILGYGDTSSQIDCYGLVQVTYSDVEGGWPGIDNIDSDPFFVKNGYWDPNGTPEDINDDFWVNGDYHLLPSSPCIDTGDPNYPEDANEFDIDGDARIIGGRIDIGADEYSFAELCDLYKDGIVNFLDYAVLASAWQTNDPNISLDDDNDVDIYDLARFCDDWLRQTTWHE